MHNKWKRVKCIDSEGSTYLKTGEVYKVEDEDSVFDSYKTEHGLIYRKNRFIPLQVRPSWDKTWMDVAKAVAERGTCPRLKVGCVIVKNGRICSTGYNGSAKGQPHCCDVGCIKNEEGRCVRALHAESNAIDFARTDLEGATAYVTASCCERCMNRLNNVGVKRVVYLNEYKNDYNHHFVGDMVVEKYIEEASND